MKSSNIGGQAVLEGIMMRNGGRYSVAVRKPDGDIEVDIRQYKSIIPWKTPLKIPFIRGIFNFVDSLVLGMKTLTFSASFFAGPVFPFWRPWCWRQREPAESGFRPEPGAAPRLRRCPYRFPQHQGLPLCVSNVLP